MTTRTCAVENPAEPCQYLTLMGFLFPGSLRGIGWNPARYFELDRIRFFMEGFELEEKINSAESARVVHKVDVLQHHLANHCMRSVYL